MTPLTDEGKRIRREVIKLAQANGGYHFGGSFSCVEILLAFFAGNGLYSPGNPLFYILPSYKAFNLFGEMLQGALMNGKDVVLLSLYAVDFVILMLLFALWRFRTKELV